MNLRNILLSLCIILMSGCASTSTWPTKPETLQPDQTTPNEDNPLVKDPETRLSFILPGTGDFLGDTTISAITHRSDDGIMLNFVNADIASVSEIILGEILGLNYAIDPEVKGSLTLQASKPVAIASLIPLFEKTLQMNGLGLIEDHGVFTVAPLTDAHTRIKPLRRSASKKLIPQGMGIWAVPLDYVSASEMQKILMPFAPASQIVQVDDARNLLMFAGTADDLTILMETVSIFDVSWLEGMSFALFELSNVDAETIVTELMPIFDDPETPVARMIKLTPLPRLNSILAITAQPEYFRNVEYWINQFDRNIETIGRTIHIYDVQYGKATDLVASLGQILGTAQSEDHGRQWQGVPPAAMGNQEDQGADLKMVADEKNNAILVMATQAEYDTVLNALKKLDTTPLQVLVEATIVEVRLNDDLNFGVEWFFRHMDRSDPDNPVASHMLNLGKAANPAQAFPGFSYAFRENDISVVLNALNSVTDVNVISSPQLLVVNNETATLQVGDQVPIATQSVIATGDANAPVVNSIQFKDTGVILEVTPRINKSGLVYLEIQQEVSDVTNTVSSGIDSPTIQQRKIRTTIVIENGELIALGGLIRETVAKGHSGVPFLKDIPLLGEVFKSNTNSLRRIELIVFITAHIIKSTEDARETTDYLRKVFELKKPFEAWQSREFPKLGEEQ